MKTQHSDKGLLLLRLVLASIFLYHGWPKMTQWGMAMEKFASMGFPGMLGPLVGLIEVAAALALLSGIWFAWANYALAIIITVAIIGVQLPGALEAGKWLTAGLERDLMILATSLFLAWTDPGKYVFKT